MTFGSKRRLFRLTTALLAAALTACNGGDGDGTGGGAGGGGGGGGGDNVPQLNVVPPTPFVTPRGTPDGTPSSASLDASGGTLRSADGLLELTVPAGALSVPTTVSIQPITNNAPGHVGHAYRLEPEGLTFAQPVTLTFTYDDAGLVGSTADALTVASQQGDGTWAATRTPVVDTGARTVSLQTTHFSDWSAVKGYVLRPSQRTARVGESLLLRIAYCVNPSWETTSGDDGIPLVSLSPMYDCDGSSYEPNDVMPVHPKATVGVWSVNGSAGGNSSIGTIGALGGTMAAIYKAPGSPPNANPVAVSVELRVPSAASAERNLTLVANIKVVDGKYYSGSASSYMVVPSEDGELRTTMTASGIRLERFEVLNGDMTKYVLQQGSVQLMRSWLDYSSGKVTVMDEQVLPPPNGSTLIVYDRVRDGTSLAGRYWLGIGEGGNVCPEQAASDGAALPSYGDDVARLEGSRSLNCTLGGVQPYTLESEWSLTLDDE